MNSPQVNPQASRLETLLGFLRQDPGNASLLADACDAAIASGAQDQARELIAVAERLQLDPDAWTFRRARCAIARRSLEEAADVLQHLQERRPADGAVAHDLAYAHFLAGRYDACCAVLRPWLEEAHRDAEPLPAPHREALELLWVRANHRLGNLKDVCDWAKVRAEHGGVSPAAQGAVSLVAVDLGDLALAQRLAQAALRANGRQPEALIALGSVAVSQGQTSAAEELLQRAVSQNPREGRAWSMLGLASLHAGKVAEARDRLERAVDAMPDHIGTWHALGWSCLLQGDHDAALNAFQRALEIDRNFSETHGAIGLVLAMRGDSAGANHHLELADRLDPSNVTGRYAKALLAGGAATSRDLERLAKKLLDRPGLLSGSLGKELMDRIGRRESP